MSPPESKTKYTRNCCPPPLGALFTSRHKLQIDCIQLPQPHSARYILPHVIPAHIPYQLDSVLPQYSY